MVSKRKITAGGSNRFSAQWKVRQTSTVRSFQNLRQNSPGFVKTHETEKRARTYIYDIGFIYASELTLRGGINTVEARIGQYDKCSESILVLPNIFSTTILVIGNMYRYIEKAPFGDTKKPHRAFLAHFQEKPRPADGKLSAF